MMENKDFKILINKFYDGKTSILEEQFLYDYFKNNTVSIDLEKDKKIFLDLYQIDDKIVIPINLSTDLEHLIDQLENKDKKSKRINWAVGIAASIMIIISCSLSIFGGKDSNHEVVNTYTDPKEAYVATQKALLLASTKLNKGFDQLQNAKNNLEKNKVLNKTF